MDYEIDTNSDYNSGFSVQDYFSDNLVSANESYLTDSGDLENNYAWEILNLVNIQRSYVGASPLTLSSTLMEGAAIRANEIITYFSHTRPNGTDCSTVVENTYPSYYIGENIAAGYYSSEDVMNGWMNSTGHRENILRSSYSELGVGLAYDSNSVYGYHWVQLFGNPYLSSKNTNEGLSFFYDSNAQIILKVGSTFNGEVWAENFRDSFDVFEIDAMNNPNDLILAGNSDYNIIYGGTGNSSLWGGTDNVDDILFGGSGAEMFWYGKYEGYDNIFNANSSDTVNLYDVNLSEISAAEISDSQVVVRFNTGTALVIYDNDQVTPTFQLGDGTRCKYDRNIEQWQDVY